MSERLAGDIDDINLNNEDQKGSFSALDVKIVDQTDLERIVARDADKAILSKDLEIEEKRLSKSNDKYLRYKNKLLILQKKLQRPNLKISEKTRLGVQIEELEDNEIINSLHDLQEIKSRIKSIKLKMDKSQNLLTNPGDDANEPKQLPDETREEYLIRTGKITAFGTSNAFIEQSDTSKQIKAPTHKNLITPGFNNFNEDENLGKLNGEDEDFKIDYDEINSDEILDDSDEIDEIDEIDLSVRKSKKRVFDEIKEQIDDGDDRYYKLRLEKWVSERSSLRKIKSPDYIDNPDIPEWYKPHPTIKDNILNSDFKLPGDVFPSLFDYQKTCVQWLCELFMQKTGGIIGDEMGLGKTVQMISFLAGLHYSKSLKGPILVVCPATVLKQWCNEFHRWWPPFRVIILHSMGEGMSKNKKFKTGEDLFDDDLEDIEYNKVKTIGQTKINANVKNLVNKIVKDGHVIITTYAGLRIYAKYLLPVKWGYVVLDEGHKIRNPDSYVTITCKQLKTSNRIILSGTPIQNNLVELWSLFDFVFPGRLGTLPVFQKQFCIPINLGGYANATNVQVQAGYKCAVILKDLVSPYLLRRVKADVAKDLPKKTEMVLFCKLTPEQRKLYRDFIESEDLKKVLAGKRNALFGIDMLRKICNHPNLVDLSIKNKKIVKLPTIEELSKKSGKIQVVIASLKLWNKEGRKILIFTQTKQMLDILQQLLDGLNKQENNAYTYMRMDGGTQIIQRQSLVDTFNTDPKYRIFLLTTRVGGLGVNLTGASRVIIYDPDWNPSTDMQARERSWRLGQKQDVAIYRLIMAGSIEEKIYHRQIFKQFLTNKILKDPKQKRFFKMTDLYDLFTLGDEEVKGTETADLFDADETTFNGIKERQSKFKFRMNKSSNHSKIMNQNQDEGDDDFIKAATIAGVSSVAEYDDEQVKEKSMFDDDDSRVNDQKKNDDSNIMSEIFKKSGIHSVVEHDSIMDKSSTASTNSSMLLIDNEATRIANEAVAALKESRKQAAKNRISVPTWTGKFGGIGNQGMNKKRKLGNGAVFGKNGNSNSSVSILENLKRKKNPAKQPNKQSEDLITQLSKYMAGIKDNFSTSTDILNNLDVDFSDKKTVDVIRKMLKSICKWDKERKGWVLNPEFK